MSQYIVTEEKIQKWVELDYSAKDCRNEVKEHPYNPQVEREKVMWEVVCKLDEEITAIEDNIPEIDDLDNIIIMQERLPGMRYVFKILEDLRQDSEQG
jgi:hypothetical protein